MSDKSTIRGGTGIRAGQILRLKTPSSVMFLDKDFSPTEITRVDIQQGELLLLIKIDWQLNMPESWVMLKALRIAKKQKVKVSITHDYFLDNYEIVDTTIIDDDDDDF